ncbi:hypothetical protein BC828DRAFT_373002 [Blastocladiella britannica]|nr:hypothetical protein BC828DRAFT_373002 [Blastocladiella britannica]
MSSILGGLGHLSISSDEEQQHQQVHHSMPRPAAILHVDTQHVPNYAPAVHHPPPVMRTVAAGIAATTIPPPSSSPLRVQAASIPVSVQLMQTELPAMAEQAILYRDDVDEEDDNRPLAETVPARPGSPMAAAAAVAARGTLMSGPWSGTSGMSPDDVPLISVIPRGHGGSSIAGSDGRSGRSASPSGSNGSQPASPVHGTLLSPSRYGSELKTKVKVFSLPLGPPSPMSAVQEIPGSAASDDVPLSMIPIGTLHQHQFMGLQQQQQQFMTLQQHQPQPQQQTMHGNNNNNMSPMSLMYMGMGMGMSMAMNGAFGAGMPFSSAAAVAGGPGGSSGSSGGASFAGMPMGYPPGMMPGMMPGHYMVPPPGAVYGMYPGAPQYGGEHYDGETAPAKTKHHKSSRSKSRDGTSSSSKHSKKDRSSKDRSGDGEGEKKSRSKSRDSTSRRHRSSSRKEEDGDVPSEVAASMDEQLTRGRRAPYNQGPNDFAGVPLRAITQTLSEPQLALPETARSVTIATVPLSGTSPASASMQRPGSRGRQPGIAVYSPALDFQRRTSTPMQPPPTSPIRSGMVQKKVVSALVARLGTNGENLGSPEDDVAGAVADKNNVD